MLLSFNISVYDLNGSLLFLLFLCVFLIHSTSKCPQGCYMGKEPPQKVIPVFPCPVVLLRLYHKVSEVASIQHQWWGYSDAIRCWPKFWLVFRYPRLYIPRLKAAREKMQTFSMQNETISPTEATILSQTTPCWCFLTSC